MVSCIGVHIVTVIVVVIRLRMTTVGTTRSPDVGVVIWGASVSRRVASSGVTYCIVVTLLTSH